MCDTRILRDVNNSTTGLLYFTIVRKSQDYNTRFKLEFVFETLPIAPVAIGIGNSDLRQLQFASQHRNFYITLFITYLSFGYRM